MGSEWIIVSYGIVGFLSLYLFKTLLQTEAARKGSGDSQSIDKKVDPITLGLELLCIGLFLFSLIGMSKGVLESYDYCSIIQQNSTTLGNFTSYEYNRVCFTNNNSEANLLYEMSYMVMYIVSALFFIGFIWNIFLFIRTDVWPRISRGFKKNR